MGANKEVCLGRSVIPSHQVEKRLIPQGIGAQCINLEKYVAEGEEKTEVKFASRLHLRIFLDGLYHVFDEPTYDSSDLRATSSKLRPEKIGVLELGILKAEGLLPPKSKDGRGTTDAYCAGDKNDGTGDPRLGKVRIRLAITVIYTHSYPLLVLQPNGLKKMGELHLAVKFSGNNWINLFHTYSQPLLPMMHYLQPLSVYQLDSLRHQATYILSSRLGRADPPLRREVVEYMLDTGENRWSLRRAKANCERVMTCLSGIVVLWREFDQIRHWKINSAITVLIYSLFVAMVMCPKLILTAFFLAPFVLGVWCFPQRDSYAMRPPRLRVGIPSIPQNFLWRLPAKTDSMLLFHLTLFSLRISLADKYSFWSLRSTPIKITGKQQLQKLIKKLPQKISVVQDCSPWKASRNTLL
ncbi:hypothetical protein Peur_024183 [Populus x canadensis]